MVRMDQLKGYSPSQPSYPEITGYGRRSDGNHQRRSDNNKATRGGLMVTDVFFPAKVLAHADQRKP